MGNKSYSFNYGHHFDFCAIQSKVRGFRLVHLWRKQQSKICFFFKLAKKQNKNCFELLYKIIIGGKHAKQTNNQMAAHSNAEMPDPTRQSTNILYITRRRSTSRSVNTTCNREDSNLNILKNRT